MFRGVADTHAVVWYVFEDPRLSKIAREFIEDAATEDLAIAASPMTLIEIIYLVEKRRLPDSTLERVRGLFEVSSLFELVAIDLQVADGVALVSRDEVPDLPDRVIAATAVHLGVPLISRDGKIRASSVTTIW